MAQQGQNSAGMLVVQSMGGEPVAARQRKMETWWSAASLNLRGKSRSACWWVLQATKKS